LEILMGLFKSVLSKVRSGLSKTRGSVADLRHILVGGPLSAEVLDRVERRLIESDVGVRTAVELVKDIRAGWERGELETGHEAWDFLRQQLVAYFPDEDRQLRLAEPGTGPTVILVAGVNGSGKTTSIAKMAKSLRDEGKSVMLAACDTFRAAAVEQLEIWSKRLDVQVIKGKQGGDPAAVAFDAAVAAVARSVDVLLVDTAGRLHTQENLMRQLGKIRSVLGRKIEGAPHEVILVLDATTGQNAITQARIFTEVIEVTGIFLAKLDGTARGGIVVAIREQLGIPVKFIGVGETPDDVEPFTPESFVDAMFSA
jgi:fused signal recognition particle receptor